MGVDGLDQEVGSGVEVIGTVFPAIQEFVL